MKDKRYKLAVKDIYNRILKEVQLSEQWKSPDSLQFRYEHHIKAVALLELLESVTIFYTGLGYYQDTKEFKKRIESFKFLESEK